MNKLAMLISVCLVALCGCAHTYVITFDNGRRITTASKPRLEHGRYVFKDAVGRQAFVPASQVREIAPASMVKEERPRFNNQQPTK